jgi:predicted nucleic acid-binding protein
VTGQAIVIDASAALRLAQGQTAAKAAIEEASEVVAPTLFLPEVANGLWKYVRAGQLDAAGATAKLRAAIALCDRIEPADADSTATALCEAARTGHPVYDLIYLGLAQREGAALATADTCLAKLAAAEGVPVEPA